jgi:hypothetical protein
MTLLLLNFQEYLFHLVEDLSWYPLPEPLTENLDPLVEALWLLAHHQHLTEELCVQGTFQDFTPTQISFYTFCSSYPLAIPLTYTDPPHPHKLGPSH